MGTIDFDWEMISVSNPHSCGPNRVKKVWLTTKSMRPNDTRLNVINISSDLIKKAGWTNGIRVNLYKSGNSLFKFSPSSVGLYKPIFTTYKANSGTMKITNILLVAELNPDRNGKEFDAWVEGNEILFRSTYD